MKLQSLIIAVTTLFFTKSSPAAVAAGDLAIISWQSDNPDFLGIVTFVDLAPGETFTFWEITTPVSSLQSLEASDLGSNQLTFDHMDNGFYTGSRTFTSVKDARNAILDQANWTTANNRGGSLPNFDGTSFTLVPEPSALLFSLTASLFLCFHRKR